MQPDENAREVGAADGKLRLLSLYGDITASKRARWAASTIVRLAGPDWQTTSEMWKIDTIQVSQPIRQMITNDAANADVMIIAASSFEPALMQWLDFLEARNRPSAGLLVGLIGDDETTKEELSLVVKPLIHSAQKMGCNFIWHWMGEDAMSDADWLIESLQNLLASKSAANNEAVFC
jgi:hypothetical protein